MTTNPAAADALTNLDDEQVKLVAFTIISVRRDAERTMPGLLGAGTVVIAERTTGEALTLWLIDRYLASLSPEERLAIEADRRYLRVHYVVSRRWPREPREFERDQLGTLAAIRDRLPPSAT